MIESSRHIAHDIDKVKIKRTLGVFTAMATMIGTMIGSGIFISPKGVLLHTGSFGLNLIVWIFCGLVSLGGALCYAELGTLIPENGGQWAYIRVGIGDIPAFLSAYTMSVILVPVGGAMQCLASSEYLLSTFFGPCGIPKVISKICGILMYWMTLHIVNHVQTTAKLLKLLLLVKVSALVLVVVGGIYWLINNGASNLEKPFEGTTDNLWGIAISFYYGIWPYGGWENLNNLCEEVKDIQKVLPRSLIFAILFMTSLYLMVNISYYSVLTTQQVLASEAVAVDWGYYIIGKWSVSFSLLVSLSIFGSVLAANHSRSRILMALARQGHMFECLSMVSVTDNAPTAVLVWYGIVGATVGITGDVFSLLEFIGFAQWIFFTLTFITLIRLKVTKYRLNDPRVFRVPLALPVIMTLIGMYIIVVPVIFDPQLKHLYAVLMILSGLLFYFPLIHFKFNFRLIEKFTVFYQLLLRVSLPDKEV